MAVGRGARRQGGFALIHAIFFMAITVSTITLVTAARTAALQAQRRDFMATQALYLAEAGVTAAVQRLEEGVPIPAVVEGSLGPGRFHAKVVRLPGGLVRIRATGLVEEVAREVLVSGSASGGRFSPSLWE